MDKLRARDRDDENGDDSYNPSIGVNIPHRAKNKVDYKSMVHESSHTRSESSAPNNDDYSDGDDDMDDDPDESQRVSSRNNYLSIFLSLSHYVSPTHFLSLFLSLSHKYTLSYRWPAFTFLSINSYYPVCSSCYTSDLLQLI